MAKNYRIIRINKRTRFRRDGTTYDVYEIEFETTSGVLDTIDVNAEEYYPEQVEKIINEITEKHEKIMKL